MKIDIEEKQKQAFHPEPPKSGELFAGLDIDNPQHPYNRQRRVVVLKGWCFHLASPHCKA
jgi:hypothetical protein